MITTKNDYRGAGYDYTSEKCTAYGDYRISGEVMQYISVNGQYVKNDVTPLHREPLGGRQHGYVGCARLPFRGCCY